MCSCSRWVRPAWAGAFLFPLHFASDLHEKHTNDPPRQHFCDWDILFLLPIPWIGPVIAPVLVSLVMIAGGVLLLRKEEVAGSFRASKTATVLVLLGSGAILFSFLLDTDASLRFQYPKPYHYELLFLGMACYAGAFIGTARRSTTTWKHGRDH